LGYKLIDLFPIIWIYIYLLGTTNCIIIYIYSFNVYFIIPLLLILNYNLYLNDNLNIFFFYSVKKWLKINLYEVCDYTFRHFKRDFKKFLYNLIRYRVKVLVFFINRASILELNFLNICLFSLKFFRFNYIYLKLCILYTIVSISYYVGLKKKFSLNLDNLWSTNFLKYSYFLKFLNRCV
jgi:hypothetical protein